MDKKKFYGLCLPKKSEKFKPVSKSVFGSDSENEDGSSTAASRSNPVGRAPKTKIEAKHLEEDPTIYEYDSIYDSMKETQTKKKVSNDVKKPRFISSLLKAADKRKKDQERRVEKKIHGERLKEGDQFKDKEAFVTSAYKKKMLEMEAEEEKERVKEQLEEMMDVTKQKDLSGFYRHYLKQTTGEEKVPEFGENDAMADRISSSSAPKRSTEDSERKEQSYGDTDSPVTSDEDTDPDQNEKCRKLSSRSGSSASASHDLKEHRDRTSKVPKHEVDHSDTSSKGRPSASRQSGSKDPRSRSPLYSDDSEYEGMKTEKQSRPKGEESRQLSPHDKHPDRRDHQRKRGRSEDEHYGQGLEGTKRGAEKRTSHKQPDKLGGNTDDDIVDSDSDKPLDDGDKARQEANISMKFVKRTVGEVFQQAQERYFRRMAVRGASKSA